ncbi:macro domain-containing protein [Thorsellia anophelis]|uniref:O-acetyl-ADP-ribose deacetylase (Regulator of RNase III), contains Macro domain n=1 Tax=Thorsellia anophelis DSM 18579 TaxID=1123402 RepID=A0A1I0DLF5_9GAMM|nr:macro domain-containing protein [Thorsellia anophelis]SET32932.1 O-acetyl-ADP-ribose deacetylase (regulator of RNase III), contains Macro domain [Thorsellia anophelis DSM 18579]
MIIFKTGNIFTENVEAIVNPVNCVGVMGRGIALQFKQRYTENYKDYVAACNRKEVQPGKMFVHRNKLLINPSFIINFPTKRHWRNQSKIEDIQLGLKDLIKVIGELNIQSVALPALGSGLGGLNWNEVRIEIQKEMSSLPDVEIIVFEPFKTELNNT